MGDEAFVNQLVHRRFKNNVFPRIHPVSGPYGGKSFLRCENYAMEQQLMSSSRSDPIYEVVQQQLHTLVIQRGRSRLVASPQYALPEHRNRRGSPSDDLPVEAVFPLSIRLFFECEDVNNAARTLRFESTDGNFTMVRDDQAFVKRVKLIVDRLHRAFASRSEATDVWNGKFTFITIEEMPIGGALGFSTA